MKIKLYGTGNGTAKKANSVFMSIDGKLLIDIPSGGQKVLLKDNFDFVNVEALLITHFHADHDFDLPHFLAFGLAMSSRTSPLTVIAPKGAKKRYKCLVELSNFAPDMKMINIIEVDAKSLKQPLNVGEYTVTPYSMVHEKNCGISLGYLIAYEGDGTVAITGDTAVCESVYEILAKSKIAFVECTALEMPEKFAKGHILVPQFEELVEQCKCKLVPVHMTDVAREELKKRNINSPSDGDVFDSNEKKGGAL